MTLPARKTDPSSAIESTRVHRTMPAGPGAGVPIPVRVIPLAGGPLIGTTSQIITASRWYKGAAALGIPAIEINRRHSELYLNTFYLEKVKRYLRGISLSLHSGTTGVFQELKSFTIAELATLRAEVDVACFLGAKEIVFHLHDALMDNDGRRRLADIIDQAAEYGVRLLYESDSFLRAATACRVLEIFPGLGYVLDLGHLNCGHRTNALGCDLDEFIDRVRQRTVYIHASNNHGTMDEHKGLEDGTLDWRRILDRLDFGRIGKIIIEVRSPEYLDASQKALTHYLATRQATAGTPYAY
ncbi:MAG: sugar phosphate isomerase/epimerase [Deltaproteobacteria bacterium]|nr:sugar phosphate isomerase/epimerase [Candidatus Anaeroferrophillacea bacterium]